MNKIAFVHPDYFPNDPRPPEFSDESLALRFAELHASNLRFVSGWGKWLGWTGTHWQFDDTLRAFDLTRQICREVSAGCNKQKIAAETFRDMPCRRETA